MKIYTHKGVLIVSEQYSPQLHTDTLRLRFLLTDGCNQACTHCLNEYQEKPTQSGEIFVVWQYRKDSQGL